MHAADRIELTNGDVLSGKVLRQDADQVVFKHPALGEMTIIKAQVKQVHLDVPDKPVPKNGPAPLPTEPAKPKPKQPDPNEVKNNAVKQAEQSKSTLDTFIEDWNSRLALGINGATGNTDQQNYYAKFDTKFEDGRDRWTFNTRWYYTESNGSRTRNQFEANLTKDWLQKDSPWFFFLKGSYKYDVNRSWLNRTSGFGGGGYTITKDDDIEVNTRLGFGGTYEYGSVNEFTPEALFGGSVIKWKLTERSAIVGDAVYYPSLEDSGEFRIESGLEWTYKLDLARGLSLRLGFENEYDSRTPADNGNNDVKYFGALVFDF